MNWHTEYLWFQTKQPRQLVRITDQVQAVVGQSGVQEGMALVSAMHITAGVLINDDEPGLHQDIETWWQQLCPDGVDYRHHRTGETNGDAHLKNLLIGHQVLIPVTRGELDLGPWQQVFYAEFDGQRKKRVIVKIWGD